MYGKKITQQDFDDMANCHSLNELVAYLRTRTHYAKNFEAVPNDISAVQIEEILHINLLEQTEILCKYEISIGQKFYQYYIAKNEIQQILTIIQLIKKGKPEAYLSVLPAFFSKKSNINLFEFTSVKSYSDLLKVLKNTDYYIILAPLSDIFNESDSYILIENALNRHLHSILYNIVSHLQTPKDKREIRELAKYKFDMEAISKIYRLIRLDLADRPTIKNCIDSEFTNFSPKEIEMFADSERARDMVRLIPNTCYKKDFSKVKFDYLEGATDRMMYIKFSKSFRYSTSPVAVMISYIFLMENEVKNIVHIVERIKYKIPPDKI